MGGRTPGRIWESLRRLAARATLRAAAAVRLVEGRRLRCGALDRRRVCGPRRRSLPARRRLGLRARLPRPPAQLLLPVLPLPRLHGLTCALHVPEVARPNAEEHLGSARARLRDVCSPSLPRRVEGSCAPGCMLSLESKTLAHTLRMGDCTDPSSCPLPSRLRLGCGGYDYHLYVFLFKLFPIARAEGDWPPSQGHGGSGLLPTRACRDAYQL